MKLYLLACLALLSLTASAQIYGKKSKGSITIFDSIEVKPGDTIFLGSGSDNRGAFAYIYTPPNAFGGTGEISLSRQYARRQATIKHFKVQKSRRLGEKTVAVVNVGGLNNVADLEPAIESGEILAINGRNFREKPVEVVQAAQGTQVNIQQAPLSKADELKKLKELLDTGVLTQDEYDSEKKKILAKE